MPNIQSAKKRLKQSLVRQERNRSVKRSIRTECRKVLMCRSDGRCPAGRDGVQDGGEEVGLRGGPQGAASQRGRSDEVSPVGANQGGEEEGRRQVNGGRGRLFGVRRGARRVVSRGRQSEQFSLKSHCRLMGLVM